MALSLSSGQETLTKNEYLTLTL